MAGVPGEALVRWCEGQHEARIAVPAERTGDRHQSVARKRVEVDAKGIDRNDVTRLTDRSMRRGRGNRIAGDAIGQRQRKSRVMPMRESIAAVPVLVERAAVTKVGDAGASHSAQATERSGVGRAPQQHVDPVAAAFQR